MEFRTPLTDEPARAEPLALHAPNPRRTAFRRRIAQVGGWLTIAMALGALLPLEPAVDASRDFVFAALGVGAFGLLCLAAQPLGRVRSWWGRGGVALVCGVLSAAGLPLFGDQAWDVQLPVPLLVIGLLSAPWTLLAARASAAPRSIARAHVIAHATLAILIIGAWLSAASSPDGVDSFPRVLAETLSPRLLVLALASAIVGSSIRGSRAGRLALATAALALVAALGRDLFTVRASIQVVDEDLSGIESLAIAANGWDVVLGATVGAMFAVVLARCLGARGRAPRALLASIGSAAVLVAWSAGGVSDTHGWAGWSPWFDGDPATRVQPVVIETRAGNFLSGYVENALVMDRAGVVVRGSALVPSGSLAIVPDARAPLTAFVEVVCTVPADTRWLQLVVVPRTSVAAGPHRLARARFATVEAAAMAIHAREIGIVSPEELADLVDARRQCAIPFPSTDTSRCPPRTRPVVVVDRVPSDATVEDLVRASLGREVMIVHRPSSTPLSLPPAEREPIRMLSDHSYLGSAALGGFVVALLTMLLVARARWSGRVAPGAELRDGSVAGPITPAWLARAACDAHIVPPEKGAYRDGNRPVLVSTARAFGRALRISAVGALRGMRPWAAIVIAAMLVVVRMLGE